MSALHTLFFSVSVAIGVSALCSVCEAVLYSISPSQVELLKKSGRNSAALLQRLKNDIEEPITAILTLNTIANTIGAAIAGAAAAKLFGDENLILFSSAFTLSILLFSEILPKTIGVTYAYTLAPYISYPLKGMVLFLKPIVWLCRKITQLLPQRKEGTISGEELQAIASLSRESGDIEENEERVINNIIDLKTKIVRQVMTPRTVTFSMDETTSVSEALGLTREMDAHSRMPVYTQEPDNVSGIVMLKDILEGAADGLNNIPISRFKKPVHFVPETAPLNRIMIDFFDRRQHLFVVVDEYGTMTGVISLEDVIEEIVGHEIIDETDEAQDMRELARSQNIELNTGP